MSKKQPALPPLLSFQAGCIWLSSILINCLICNKKGRGRRGCGRCAAPPDSFALSAAKKIEAGGAVGAVQPRPIHLPCLQQKMSRTAGLWALCSPARFICLICNKKGRGRRGRGRCAAPTDSFALSAAKKVEDGGAVGAVQPRPIHLPYLQQKRSRTAGLWTLCSPDGFICLICSKKDRGRLGCGRCAAPPDSFALSAAKNVEDGGAVGAVQPRPIHLPCLQQKRSRTAGPRALCRPARFICLICSKKGRGRLGRGRCAAPPDSFALSATKKVEDGGAVGAVQPRPIHLPCLQQKRSRTAGPRALCRPARFICLICSKKGRGRLGRGRCAAPPDSFALSAAKKIEAGGAAGAVQPRPIHLPYLQQKMSRTAGPGAL